MTPTRRRRLILLGLLLLGLSAAAALGLTAFRQNMLYFHEPSQIAAGDVPPHVRFRIGGLVKPGSVVRDRDDLEVQFIVADCRAGVSVRYQGTLPDLFRQGQGVIAYGALDGHGHFVADRVLAKHDATYMSPEVARSLNKQQASDADRRCMPANLQAGR